jgi:hypothetical protein
MQAEWGKCGGNRDTHWTMLPFVGIDDALSGWGWVALSGFAFIAFNLWRRGKSGD